MQSRNIANHVRPSTEPTLPRSRRSSSRDRLFRNSMEDCKWDSGGLSARFNPDISSSLERGDRLWRSLPG
jgi:hypothetical protein